MPYIGKMENEIFVGNIKSGDDLSDLNSLDFRLSIPALDIHGKKLNNNYRAVFINKKDIEKYHKRKDAEMARIRRM